MTTFIGRGIIRGIFISIYCTNYCRYYHLKILTDPFFGTINGIPTQLQILNEPISFLQVRDMTINFLGFEFVSQLLYHLLFYLSLGDIFL